MSNQDQNQAENANTDDDILDLTAACLERMRKYYAPGGLYQQQQERNSNKQPEIKNSRQVYPTKKSTRA